jgi:hypothetical protein
MTLYRLVVALRPTGPVAGPLFVAAALFATTLVVPSLVDRPVAEAQAAIGGEVLVVLAKEGEGEIDADLRDVPALRRPPFNAFRSMRVLSRPRVQLRQGRAEEVRLPNGRRVQIMLQQVLPDGRFRVRVSINRPDENDYLPLLTVVASPGDPFFVAGQRHDGGTLVIGVRIGERAAPSAAPARRTR